MDAKEFVDKLEDMLRELKHTENIPEEDWSNQTLPTYLEAMHAYMETVYAGSPLSKTKEISWEDLGLIFESAKSYE